MPPFRNKCGAPPLSILIGPEAAAIAAAGDGGSSDAEGGDGAIAALALAGDPTRVLCRGQRVVLHDLTSNTALNGLYGHAVAFRADEQRYNVWLDVDQDVEQVQSDEESEIRQK